MIDFLLGVPGKLKTISDYLTTNWTTARAAKVDNLDAAVTTRAASATALTNAIWTDARAAKLDAAIQTSVIQSVQTGSFNGFNLTGTGEDANYKDITISAVTVAKSIVLMQGSFTSNPGTELYTCLGRLTSTTNLRVSSKSVMDTSSGNVPYVRWTVVEFK